MGSFVLQQALGLRDLRLSSTMNLGGATAAAMVQHAALAIDAGLATTVACVFSDAPLKPPKPAPRRQEGRRLGRRVRIRARAERRLRAVRRQRDVRAWSRAGTCTLRHDQRRPRCRRRRRSALGPTEPAAQFHDSR